MRGLPCRVEAKPHCGLSAIAEWWAVGDSNLDRMEQRGFDVYRERVRLSSGEKLRITAKLWTASLLPRRNPD